MELVRDPLLFKEVHEEVQQAFTVDASTGKHILDTQKLLSLPLLNSIYTEVLRMRISFSITREVQQDIDIGGYRIAKHSLIQAPTHVAHYDETLWQVDDDQPPLSVFWAARHLEHFEKVDDSGQRSRRSRFSMKASPNGYFPYGMWTKHFFPFDTLRSAMAEFDMQGIQEADIFTNNGSNLGGGTSMCPGRQFAKREILMTLAIIVAKFDIEFMDWIHPTGEKSDRAAEGDRKYAGVVAVPPDRDMLIRWRRKW